MGPILEASPAGCAIAAALVVAGAPLFSAGLRTLRLRRHLRGIAPADLNQEATGFGLFRARVALESPLFGPLSGKPCAGYRLEVVGARGMRVATLEDLRPFRLVAEDVMAHVSADHEARWDLAVVAEREVAPGATMSENLTHLLQSSPEAMWLRRAGMTLTLVEHALLAGAECYVAGSVRRTRPYEVEAEVELARTGTDDAAVVSPARVAPVPDLWIESDGHLEYLHVSDGPPTAAALAVPTWRLTGLVLGPLIGMAGMLYLAAMADALRALARFAR